MLELRLAGWRRASRPTSTAGPAPAPGSPTAVPGRADTRLRPAESLLTSVEEAVGGPSVPFDRSLARPRRVASIVRSRPEPWCRRRPTRRRPLFRRRRLWRAAEALLTVDVRTAKTAATRLLGSRRRGGCAGRAPLAAEVADLARRGGHLNPRYRGGGRRQWSMEELAVRGLTSRRVEVLRLLGEGRSNREIGETLFISAKTASVHVTHILQKLNVTTRVQAAVAADRLALE